MILGNSIFDLLPSKRQVLDKFKVFYDQIYKRCYNSKKDMIYSPSKEFRL